MTKRREPLGWKAAVQGAYPDYHPLLAIAALAHRKDCPPDLALKCHIELAGYWEAKPKPVDKKGSSDVVIKWALPKTALDRGT